MTNQTNNLRKVCIIANRLVKRGLSRPAAFSQAWVKVKASAILTKVNGVSFGHRQEALQRLSRYAKEQVIIHLEREANKLDSFAVAVIVEVIGKGSYKMGYLPNTLAGLVSLILDKGIPLQSQFKEVRGGKARKDHYGMEIELSLAG
jgi:hypothetical protein